MASSIGLDLVVKKLEEEKSRYLRAGHSGMFCDSATCLKTACAIQFGIGAIQELRKQIKV